MIRTREQKSSAAALKQVSFRLDNHNSNQIEEPKSLPKTSSNITVSELSWKADNESSSSGGAGDGSSSSSSSSKPSSSSSPGAAVVKHRIPSLSSNLIRTHPKHRDPLRYYTVTKVLGEGSMGSVSMVRKRTFGGSARKSYVEDEHKVYGNKEHDDCLFWLSRYFPYCFPGSSCGEKNKKKMDSFVVVSDDSNNTDSSNNDASSSSTFTESEYNDNNNNHKTNKEDKIHGYQSNKKSSSMISFGANHEVMVDYALKTILLDQCRSSVLKRELKNEIAILRSLDHPNIVRALELYDYHRKLYLILELCNGGDLYVRDPYVEYQAKSIAYSLFDAVAYLHSKHITHRDLKYENIMFASPTSSTVKIIDFGLSKKYGKTQGNNKTNIATTMMNDMVGTIYTMAPEVLEGRHYNEKCDVWSLGVITFMLVSSSVPFFGDTRKETAAQILQQPRIWKLTGHRWQGITTQAKDYIRKTMVHDVTERPSATQALMHPWLESYSNTDKEESKPMVQQISPAIMDRVISSIQAFAGYKHIKKLALLVIAHQSSKYSCCLLTLLLLFYP